MASIKSEQKLKEFVQCCLKLVLPRISMCRKAALAGAKIAPADNPAAISRTFPANGDIFARAASFRADRFFLVITERDLALRHDARPYIACNIARRVPRTTIRISIILNFIL